MTLRTATLFLLMAPILGCGATALPPRDASLSELVDFASKHPRHAKNARVQFRIETARWMRTRRADKALTYRRFLELHPRGHYTAAARSRLAALSLRGARSAAQLELVIERFGDLPEGRAAEDRLALLEANAALASNSMRLARRFLARYPDHPRAAAIRAKLAQAVYKTLAADPEKLLRFAQRFFDTPSAALARRRARGLLATKLRRFPSREGLAALVARFPELTGDRQLHHLVARAIVRRRLARMQLVGLSGLADWIRSRLGERSPLLDALALVEARCTRPGKQGAAKATIKAKPSTPRFCSTLAKLGPAALPYESTVSIAELERETRHADPMRGWKAMVHLAHHDDARAADLLVELCSEPLLVNVGVAWRMLAIWLGRQAPQRRQAWVAATLRRLARNREPGARQARALLAWLTRDHRRARSLLLPLAAQSRFGLVAGYLLERMAKRDSASFGQPRVFAVQARRRMRDLAAAFPKRLDDASLVAATLAERQLFVLAQALEKGLLAEQARALLSSWRRRLLARFAHFRLASPAAYSLDHEIGRHARGRRGALLALLRGRARLYHVIAKAVCAELEPRAPNALRSLCHRRFAGGKYAPF